MCAKIRHVGCDRVIVFTKHTGYQNGSLLATIGKKVAVPEIQGIEQTAMTVEPIKWDSADHLKTKEDIAAYLEAVFEDGDPALITHALGVVARAERMSE